MKYIILLLGLLSLNACNKSELKPGDCYRGKDGTLVLIEIIGTYREGQSYTFAVVMFGQIPAATRAAGPTEKLVETLKQEGFEQVNTKECDARLAEFQGQGAQ